MMADGIQHEKAIFHAARALGSAEERSTYLAHACGTDGPLRERIEALLKVYETEQSCDGLRPSVGSALFEQFAPAIDDPVGTVIGRYKLLERIGEGGFGVVYTAEQQHPVRRTVALKVIKPGLDTKQVIARFEAERQALAMMDHENIARVLDAGATEAGRPYFVMELVRGVPVTQYCDDNKLTPRQRLELFVKVCRAVQHAHTKGIIHRDIKPTNVLVTLQDGTAIPKVIDFGVAKATGQQPLTDATQFTQFAQMVGTPLYMSPEQAEMRSLDVDTRSDVYSLGVLLYELLTGTTPFDKERLKQAAADEVRRIIREEEPPKPSTRLSTAADLAGIAARRGLEPKKLGGIVRGELDWIVMRALEKERSRRYETANGLARDVQRHLNNEAVEASPPSMAYRMRKYVSRHRMGLAVTTLLIASLLIAMGGVGWALRDHAARQARVSGQLELILEEVAKLEQAEKWLQALVAARRAEPALASGDATAQIESRARQALSDLQLVQRIEETRGNTGTAWADPRRSVQADQDYAAAFREAGIDFATLPARVAADRITARNSVAAALLPALDDWIALRSRSKNPDTARPLIEVLQLADPDPWRQRLRETLARKDWAEAARLARLPDLERQPAATLTFFSSSLEGYSTDALKTEILRRAQRKYPNDYWINHRLGVNLTYTRDPHLVEEGIGFMRAAVALRPDSCQARMNLGNGFAFAGRLDEALACHRDAIELHPEGTGAPHYNDLGEVLAQKEMYKEAIAAYEDAIRLSGSKESARIEFAMLLSTCPDSRLRDPRRAEAIAEKAVHDAPLGNHWRALGAARYRLGKWPEARAAFEKALPHTGFESGSYCWPQAIDWLFLAMSHWQTGQLDDSRRCHQKAIAWIEQNKRFENALVRHLRAEADELLKHAPQ